MVVARRLGDILTRRGLVTPEQVQSALARQKETGQLLGEILLEQGLVTDEEIADALAESFGLERYDVDANPPTPEALGHMSADLCEECRAIPLAVENEALLVGLVDPGDVSSRDTLRRALRGRKLREVVISPSAYERAKSTLYDLKKVVDGLPQDLERGPTTHEIQHAPGDLARLAIQQPTVRMVDELLRRAVSARASDLHIEPASDGAIVKMRVDGKLRTTLRIPMSAHRAVVSRIKVLAEMDIANRLTPQDGHFTVRLGEGAIDIRVSTLPVVGGERAVLRLLKDSDVLPDLDSLGLGSGCLEVMRRLLDDPQGMLIVAGPTGSGKSTTLYAALGHLIAAQPSIVTVEDPVERNIPGVKQAQVNVRAGLTFATALRSILRHDPDVIMVGETRDLETARIASQAALTGHLVLTTLHTNGALAIPARLIDLGLEPYLVSASVTGVYAQRLARLTCRACGEEAPISEHHREMLQTLVGHEDIPTTEFRGQGCEHCGFTGYAEREAIAEILEMDHQMQKLIYGEASLAALREHAQCHGMKTMRDAGLAKVRDKLTTAAEILRVVPPPIASA